MDYSTLLRSNNLKATPQRLTIVEDLHLRGHMNVDEIYESLQKKFPSISLATIYKNINLMMETLLNEVKIPRRKTVYELVKTEHAHVVCSNCDEITDVELDTSSLFSQASTLSGHDLLASAIVFKGLCVTCR